MKGSMIEGVVSLTLIPDYPTRRRCQEFNPDARYQSMWLYYLHVLANRSCVMTDQS